MTSTLERQLEEQSSVNLALLAGNEAILREHAARLAETKEDAPSLAHDVSEMWRKFREGDRS